VTKGETVGEGEVPLLFCSLPNPIHRLPAVTKHWCHPVDLAEEEKENYLYEAIRLVKSIGRENEGERGGGGKQNFYLDRKGN